MKDENIYSIGQGTNANIKIDFLTKCEAEDVNVIGSICSTGLQ